MGRPGKPKPEKRIQKSINLKPENAAYLDHLAEECGIPISRFIDDLLSEMRGEAANITVVVKKMVQVIATLDRISEKLGIEDHKTHCSENMSRVLKA